MYDAVVVGARCAGASTALLLARKGYRVQLVDRARFPSDTMRNHFILYRGMRHLHRWGLLDRIAATTCPPVRRTSVNLGDFPLIGQPPAEAGIPGEFAPRRIVLDKLLIDAAVAAGAHFAEGCTVTGVLREDDRVTGIQARTAGGAPMEVRARVVIGADGQHSSIARFVGATTYDEQPARTCGYFSYWSGTGVEGMEVAILGRPILVLAFPTNDGLTCVAAQWPIGEFRAIRADIEGGFLRALDLVPELAERVRGGRREERFRGTADLPNFFRTAAGPGWALAGDAGIHKDPFTASGISDAFCHAELLTEAIDAGLSGREDLDEALAEYGRRRDVATRPHYEEACRASSFLPLPPEVFRLRAALRGNQALIDRFYGVGRGTVPAEEFAPENLQRILGGSDQPPPA